MLWLASLSLLHALGLGQSRTTVQLSTASLTSIDVPHARSSTPTQIVLAVAALVLALALALALPAFL